MSFEVFFDGIVLLEDEDIWPDGDAPENPTPEDVVAVMKKSGPPLRVLEDWNLASEVQLTVRQVWPLSPHKHSMVSARYPA